jgi:4-amino-4-deoxy-L-arabinose transferase
MVRLFQHYPRIVLIGIFLMLYIAPLGVRPMVVPDEPRYGEIPREMIETGDWVVPRLNGVRYFEKPVMGYWLTALSIKLFGENAFAVRLPSAAAAGLSAWMVFILARRLFGRDVEASLAALIFLTSFEVMGVGVFAVLDSVLAMFITAAMAAFFLAVSSSEGSGRERGFLVLFGICCGMAFLTKGFLAFAVPVVAIVPFMIWERRMLYLLRICWIPMAAATLVSLPWTVAVHHRAPDFWHFFIWNEHIRRFMAEDAQHRAAFFYYFLLFPPAALPWAVWLPAAVKGVAGKGFDPPLVRYAMTWFFFPLLFFSIASGKILTYILPCFPPFALLMMWGLYYMDPKGGSRKMLKAGAFGLAVLMAILGVLLPLVQVIGPWGVRPYGSHWKWLLACAGLFVFALLLRAASREADRGKRILLFGLSPVLLLSSAHFLMPDDTVEHKSPGAFLAAHAERVVPETTLVSLEDPIRAVSWVYKRDDVYQLMAGGELAHGFGYDDARDRILTLAQLDLLIRSRAKAGRVVLVAKTKKYKDWRNRLPEPLFEADSGPGGYVFVQY